MGDSKNIPLIYAAWEHLWNKTDLFSNYRSAETGVKVEVKEEVTEKSASFTYIEKPPNDFKLLLPFYIMCLSFPTDLKNWIQDQKENQDSNPFVSPRLIRVPELVLKTLDKFSMKNLHQMLSIPQLDFLIKFYLENEELKYAKNKTNAVFEYILKFTT